MVRMGRSTADRRRGFTLIEILVVVAIIALLISIMLPSLTRARAQSQFVVCQTHLKEMGKAVSMYAMEYRDVLPGPQHPAMFTKTEQWISDSQFYRSYYLPNMLRKYFGEKGTNSRKSVSDSIATCPTYPRSDEEMLKDTIGAANYCINTAPDTTPKYYFGFTNAGVPDWESWLNSDSYGKKPEMHPKKMTLVKQPARKWMIGDAWAKPWNDSQTMGDYPGLASGTWRLENSNADNTGKYLAKSPFHLGAGYQKGSPSSTYKGKTSVLFFDTHVEGVVSDYWSKYEVMLATEKK